MSVTQNQKPKKEKKDTLPCVRHFRLTDADATTWDAKVSRSGQTASEFFRSAVIQNQTVVQGDASKKKRAVRTKNTLPTDLKKLLFLTAQASNNLNQIAHRLNADHKAGKVTPSLYASIFDEIKDISATVKGWE